MENEEIKKEEVEVQVEEPEVKIEDKEGKEIEKPLNEVIEEKLKNLDKKEMNLQTALLLGIYRHYCPEPKEPEPTPEPSEEDLLKQELVLKRQQLKNHHARIDGGKVAIGQGNLATLLPIDEEIKRRQDEVKLLEIEIQYDVPMRAHFRYEEIDDWRRIQRDIKTKGKGGLNERKEILEKLKEQKEKVLKEIPELQKQINELEEKTGVPKTNFINTN